MAAEEEQGTTHGPEPPAEPSSVPDSSGAPQATPKKSAGRTRKEPAVAAAVKKVTGPKAPRRPALDPELARLLAERRAQDDRRPKFVRQQAHRYFAIGRWDTWRRPRGQQSKQRRHYGYRPTVVSIGFGSPRRTRGLTPTGFVPVLVRRPEEIEAIDLTHQAAIIARTVGTRRRIQIEEAARKRGVHVINPLLRDREEN